MKTLFQTPKKGFKHAFDWYLISKLEIYGYISIQYFFLSFYKNSNNVNMTEQGIILLIKQQSMKGQSTESHFLDETMLVFL